MSYPSVTIARKAGLTALFAVMTLCLSPKDNSEARTKSQLGASAVITANPAATSAAERILDLGGSAVDAAIAAQLVLGVVEPQSSGIGGGSVVLYREPANGPIRAFDGLARSPAAYDPQANSDPRFRHSGAAVGVPGTVRLMGLLYSRYGKLPWGTLFDPAIELASKGFKVSPYLAESLKIANGAGFTLPPWLSDDAGEPVKVGALIRNEALAATMREIANSGPVALYGGMSPDIVASVRNSALPGAMTQDDLKTYKAVERTPLCTHYLSLRVCAFPPPSYGGMVVLEMLKLLTQIHAGSPDFLDANFVHVFLETGKLAEADRANVVGDPDIETVSVTPFLHQEYLQRRANLVNTTRSMKEPVGSGGDGTEPTCLSTATPLPPSTSQVVIMDHWGAALSMTTTINVNFGSWLTARGFFLNNAMTNFSCANNRPAPHKRPETSMVPVLATNTAGQTSLLGGSAGGPEIVDYVAQAVLQITHGVSPLAALDAGHVSSALSPYGRSPGLIELEKGRAVAALSDDLQRLGHQITIRPLESGLGFLAWQNGEWSGAADTRRDGNSIVRNATAHPAYH